MTRAALTECYFRTMLNVSNVFVHKLIEKNHNIISSCQSISLRKGGKPWKVILPAVMSTFPKSLMTGELWCKIIWWAVHSPCKNTMGCRYLLWCQSGAEFKENLFSLISALIGPLGSAAITAHSSIRRTLVPIRKTKKKRETLSLQMNTPGTSETFSPLCGAELCWRLM